MAALCGLAMLLAMPVEAQPSAAVQRDALQWPHGSYLIGGVILFAAQLALIVGLLVQGVRRRRAEAASRKAEERYRSVVETQSDLICRFLPDTTLTFVNDAYCRFWGKAPDELLGKQFIELVPAAFHQLVLDRISHLANGSESHEHPVVMADGSVGWQHWINHAILDRSGRVIELQGVGRDITDRKRVEESLWDLEARHSAILRAMPDLMLVLLRDGTFADYHARDPDLLFLPPEQFLGKTVTDVLPASLAVTLMDAIERTSRVDGPVVVEFDLLLDELRQFEARFVDAENGRVLSVVRDVTDSKRTQARNRDLAGRLIASQEAERTRIARDLHDDVCQDIATVSVDLSHIRRCAGAVNNPELQTLLQATQRRTESVAENLRLLSHGLHPSILQHIGLVAALQAHCAEVERQHDVNVQFYTDGEVETCNQVTALSLFRIAQEALRNIAKHGDARHARVSLSRVARDLTLVVADDGCGFDVAAVRRSGAGLGLVSIEERARLAKGQATVTSRPGQGTVVQIRVALDDDEDVLDSDRDERTDAPAGRNLECN